MPSPYTQIFDKDTYVEMLYPTTNFGNSNYLLLLYDVGGGKVPQPDYRNIFAYADFSALDIVASQVTLAYAWMRYNILSSEEMKWTRVTTDWGETAITWDNQWTGRGLDGTVMSGHASGPSGGWLRWDITTMITDAINNRAKVWNAYLTYTGTPASPSLGEFLAHEYGYLQPYIEIVYSPLAAARRNWGQVIP